MTRAPNTRVVVFVGPSLPAHLRPADGRIDWRPPAVAGDAIEVGRSRPSAVLLIDGLFDEWPAIRHKDLLQLVSDGVAVFGAASMGALRAAELHPFGMVGIGRIYTAYRRGWIDADDEVAVVHGPKEFDWSPLTEPLVNVRATLLHAVRCRVVSAAEARAILSAARSIFYKTRTWSAILQSPAVMDEVETNRQEMFRAWLGKGYVDLKRLDALLAVDTVLRGDICSHARQLAPPVTSFSAALELQVLSGLRPRS